MDKVYKSRGIRVYSEFNLQCKLADKVSRAQRGDSWTLFINKAGILAHAVHRNGIFLRLEGPYYLAGCREEYTVNYFFNKLREVSNG